MGRRLSPEKIDGIVHALKNGLPGSEIAAKYAIQIQQVRKIHGHLSQTGHYASVHVGLPIPPLQSKPRKTWRVRNVVRMKVWHILAGKGKRTPAEIHQLLADEGFALTRTHLQNALGEMVDKGYLNHESKFYSRRETFRIP